MRKNFYSNGKLLITGEYLVLDGALALALPTKFGQNLIIEEGSEEKIIWKSFDYDKKIWFEDEILFSEIINNVVDKNDKTKTTLIEILHHGYLINPNFIKKADGFQIKTELSFPKVWGLGTSSTLINNIAQWLEIDAFLLLKNSFGGSGYDIACAQNNTPILYQLINNKPNINKIDFNPFFKNNIYFVYLNKKQSSKDAIKNYMENKEDISNNIIHINQISKDIIRVNKLSDFIYLLNEHENELSKILKTKKIQESIFPDFNGVIKSLGAWGGDFVMAVSNNNPSTYFKLKGYHTIIPYSDIII